MDRRNSPSGAAGICAYTRVYSGVIAIAILFIDKTQQFLLLQIRCAEDDGDRAASVAAGLAIQHSKNNSGYSFKVLAVLLVLTVMSILPMPVWAQQASCPMAAYQTIGSSPPDSVVQLYEIDITTGNLTLIGNDTEMNGVGNAGGFNAMGFNPADGFLYGFNNATDRVVKVSQAGSASNIGPANSALASVGMIGGDIINGQLYTYSNGPNLNIYVFDITTGGLLQTIPVSEVIGGGDFSYNPLDGLLYAITGNGDIRVVDPATGGVTSLPEIRLPAGNYGATFMDNQGSLYTVENGSGNIYRVSNLGSPGHDFYEKIGVSISTMQNDGARCVDAPPSIAQVRVVKSLLAESVRTDGIAQSGEQLTYQFDLSNVGGAATSSSHSFYEVLPLYSTLVSVTDGSIDCAIGSVGARLCTITTNAAIAAGGTATVFMQVQVDDELPETATELVNVITDSTGDPPLSGCSASNQACTSQPSCDPVIDPDHCVVIPLVQRPDLRIIKTASPNPIYAGTTAVNYTLTIDNVGIVDVNNAVITDIPDASHDCMRPATTANCIATGGATCPNGTANSSVNISDLIGAGVRIPTMPVNGQVVLTMQCMVTASGQP